MRFIVIAAERPDGAAEPGAAPIGHENPCCLVDLGSSRSSVWRRSRAEWAFAAIDAEQSLQPHSCARRFDMGTVFA
jgi:hypothetical protein